MKSKSKLFYAMAFIATFVVGFLIGLFIEYPNVNEQEISGTIGKVSNYRNAKATEADIELQNDLMTDQKMQQSLSGYMTFYYTKSIEFGKTIAFAVEQAKADEAFAAQHSAQLAVVEKFAEFLGTSRKDLLMAMLVCQSVDEATPEMLRNAIAQANNIIAQMNHRNSTVITFIESLDVYILKTGRAANENLNRAHDLLVFNQIGASAVVKDKVLLAYFDKKQLFAKNTNTTPTDVKGSMIKDLETLNSIYWTDMEKLGFWDNEKLGAACDKETLGVRLMDNEKLGYLVNDMEVLGGIVALDAERLGAGFTDAEKLSGRPLFFDTEKLGGAFMDSEKLGLWDNEKLGRIPAL